MSSSSLEIPRSVAIVGRPNVGKSRLFNRILNRRVSIVHDAPGVTRDLIVEECPEQGFLLMDTGGIGLVTELTPKVITDAIEEQVNFAINAAGIVLLVVDVTEGCVPLDFQVAERLRRFGKKVILVANKCDNEERSNLAGDFFELGFDAPIMLSAEHGNGVGFLLAKIAGILGPKPEKTPEQIALERGPDRIKIALAGRPNVGKSSIGNRLLKSERLTVSEIAGTTRDPVKCHLDYTTESGDQLHFELVDTAGRRATTRHDVLDFFSELRSDEALEASDIVVLVLNADEGVTRMDKQLAGRVAEAGAGLIIVVNKWDLVHKEFRAGVLVEGYKDESDFRRHYKSRLLSELFFLPDSPVLFTSAKTDFRTEEILVTAAEIHKRMYQKITTGQLNKAIEKLFEANPPRLVGGRRFKCYYALQTRTRPFTIRFYCNSEERLDEQYERYLNKGLHESFDLAGVPMKFRFVGKPKQGAEDEHQRAFYKDQQTAVVGGKRQTKASAGAIGKYNATGEAKTKKGTRGAKKKEGEWYWKTKEAPEKKPKAPSRPTVGSLSNPTGKRTSAKPKAKPAAAPAPAASPRPMRGSKKPAAAKSGFKAGAAQAPRAVGAKKAGPARAKKGSGGYKHRGQSDQQRPRR